MRYFGLEPTTPAVQCAGGIESEPILTVTSDPQVTLRCFKLSYCYLVRGINTRILRSCWQDSKYVNDIWTLQNYCLVHTVCNTSTMVLQHMLLK